LSQEDYDRATTTDYELVPSTTRIKSKALRCYLQWGTSKVNSSRKTVLQRERDSKINVTMPAGHTLPLTFAFDFTASYFRISYVVPEPEPVILSGSGSDLNLVVPPVPGPVPVPHPCSAQLPSTPLTR